MKKPPRGHKTTPFRRWDQEKEREEASGGGAGLAALAAEVMQVGGILDNAVVERMADLQAFIAYEINALDGLVDSLAVEDAPLELLDPDAEQFLILALDLAPPASSFGRSASSSCSSASVIPT